MTEIPKRLKPKPETLRELFLKSGNLCAFPNCTALMMNEQGVFIGQVCHIKAAENGGPRFSPAMTNEQRRAPANLMLMCYAHHQVTDDEKKFPVNKLRKMKRDHERRFSAPDRAILERLTDWTTADKPTQVKNLRRMNDVLQWRHSDEELSLSVAELNEYIERFRVVPIEVRRFVGAMAQRMHRMRDTSAVHDDLFGIGILISDVRDAFKIGDSTIRKRLSQLESSGILQADAYAGYNRLYAAGRSPGPVTEAACWSHSRRKFFELADIAASKRRGKNAPPISPVALEAVKRIDLLFDIERGINGKPTEQRLALRQQLGAPVLADLKGWMQAERKKLSRHSPVAKAMDYMLRRWDRFARFLDDGRICLTNNAAERALRGIALGRKSWLFCGSDRGGVRAAAMYTLIGTAKLNNVDPQAWLADVLGKIAGTPQSQLDELSGRALARASLGGGFPVLPFRLQGGGTVPPWTTFPAALPKIPYVGFSPVRLQASGTSQFGTEPSAGSSRSRPIPPYPRTDAAFAPPFDNASRRLMFHLCVRNRRLQHRHLSPEALAPAGLCCPGHHRLSASSASLDISASFPGTTGYRRGL